MARLSLKEPHAHVGLQTLRQVEGTDRGGAGVPGPLQVHRRGHCSCWNPRCHPFLLPGGKPGPGPLTRHLQGRRWLYGNSLLVLNMTDDKVLMVG